MKLINAKIKNFRLLEEVSLSFDNRTTVIVGRNNTGKTSLTEVFNRFLGASKPRFRLEDFSINIIPKFKDALVSWHAGKKNDALIELPMIELETTYNYEDESSDYGKLSDFIIDFDADLFSAIILFEYRLIDGKLDQFFESANIDDGNSFLNSLNDKISKYYETYVYAIDPTDRSNKSLRDISRVRNLVTVEFIHAQRGLDDETSSEKDLLGKVITNIFKVGSVEDAPEDMRIKTKELEDEVDELQKQINGEFRNKVNALLPALQIFGYPGLSDPELTTETNLNIESFLESNTKVLYKKENGICLPETYNGLGSRNLIYILFQLYDYFRKYQSSNGSIKAQIIFIEEPEVHLHPQMQEVFIKKLEEIVCSFIKTLNANHIWNVQFVVSTHSSHIANEAQFSSVRYFLSKTGVCQHTCIKDLNSEFSVADNIPDRDFIHKYLTLTKCDLFFADKAVIFEGSTERILMPEFIKRIDKKYSTRLSNQYISSIEIGGAYAHHFYKFLDFLELKTLIITDLDSTKLDTVTSRYCSCIVSEANNTSNSGLKHWFLDIKDDIKSIIKSSSESKVIGFKRIAFQIPENGLEVIGRSFEESFILANIKKFGIEKEDALEHAVSKIAEEIEKDGKADFAIKYALENTDWVVPLYIDEGLKWLSE